MKNEMEKKWFLIIYYDVILFINRKFVKYKANHDERMS